MIFLILALMCTQCHSLTATSVMNMGTVFQSILPNLHDPQCGLAYHSLMTTTPTPMQPFNQQPVLPTTCTISAVGGTNTEIRCGFYKGYIEVMSQDGIGINIILKCPLTSQLFNNLRKYITLQYLPEPRVSETSCA